MQSFGLVVAVGGKGLVMLFDEMEALAELPRVSERKAHRVLDDLLLNAADLTHAYIVLAYTPAFVTTLRGRRSDGASKMAVTWARFCDENEMRLEPLDAGERADLARRLALLHGLAYGWEAEPPPPDPGWPGTATETTDTRFNHEDEAPKKSWLGALRMQAGMIMLLLPFDPLLHLKGGYSSSPLRVLGGSSFRPMPRARSQYSRRLRSTVVEVG
jgi:hypothetical protein